MIAPECRGVERLQRQCQDPELVAMLPQNTAAADELPGHGSRDGPNALFCRIWVECVSEDPGGEKVPYSI